MKKISLNFIYNLLYKILLIIAPLITTPYLSRKLGADPIGEYSYVSTLVSMLLLIGGLGTSLYGRRGIAQRRDNIAEKSTFFKEIFLIRIIGIFSCFVLYIVICFFSENKILYLICSIEIIAYIFDISWLYEGDEDFGKILFRNIILKLITICLIFLLVNSPQDLGVYAAIRALSVLLSNLSLWPFLSRHVSLRKKYHLDIPRHMSSVMRLLIPQISTQIYSNSDKLMLQWITNNNAENGYYDQAYKIIEICILPVTALSATFTPRLSYLYSSGKKEEYKSLLDKSIQLTMMILFPMSIGLFFISDEFINIFLGSGFEKVGFLLKLYSPYLALSIFSGFICQQYLVVSGQDGKYMKITSLGAAFNVTVNLFILKWLGSAGAVISTVLSETFLMIVTLVLCKKDGVFSLKEIVYYSKNYVLSSLIMSLILVVFNYVFTESLILLLVKIVVGVLSYVISLIILKDFTMRFLLKLVVEGVKNGR